MDKIKVLNIIKTTFNNSYWMEYKYKNYYGYEIINTYEEAAQLENKYNNNIELYNKLINKNHYRILNNPLDGLIHDTLISDNEMLFIDYEDADAYDINAQDIKSIKEDIKKYNLYDYIELCNNDYLITIYGGIIKEFLF